MRPRFADVMHRMALRLGYPLLLRVERVLRLRSKVAEVAVWHGDKVLLVEHSYRPGRCLPGGSIGLRETPLCAAVRELREEVGILVRPDDLTPLCLFHQPLKSTWLFEYRPARVPPVVPDECEVVTARFVASHELPRRIGQLLTVAARQ